MRMCSPRIYTQLREQIGTEMQKKSKVVVCGLLLAWSALALAAPLLEQWRGTGADADKIFCKYGDGRVTVISGNQNCPLSN